MNVAGMGLVFGRGRGIGALEEALRQGWTPPAEVEIPLAPGTKIPVYSVGQETVKDKTVLKHMRRADRFSKMAALAAWDAVQDSGMAGQRHNEQLGIILATAFGPQVTAFRFLDEILEHGDAKASPTLFSHSVHNAAVSYIASALASRGPTLTLTQFAFSFHQALILAEAWLEEGRCGSVLVGCAEECGVVMEYICREKLRIAEDGKIRCFDFSASPLAVPGEGSVFFLLTRGDETTRYCEISGASLDGKEVAGDLDLCILDCDGMGGDETPYREVGEAGSRELVIGGYSPLFGSMMTGSAFNCAAAALMLMKQTRYACPVQENPHGLRICTRTERAQISRIQCVKYDCCSERAVIELAK